MSETQKIRKVVKQWLEHADEDLRLAKHAFKLSSSRPNKLIAYHAQQCVEKYLKGFLALRKEGLKLT